jgi:glycosyltransferase involved in cell wall biosynthesis
MATQTGRVTIVIPTYNRAHLVGHAIESALNQTYQNLEVFVVDDGSTDNTKEVVESYGSRVKYIYQENAGPSAARNNGVRRSEAEFIGFLDSDDIYLPLKLEKQVAYLNTHPEMDVVLCYWSLIREDRVTPFKEFTELPTDNMLKRILLTGTSGYFPPHVALLRRDCFIRVGGFIESLPAREEQAFWMHVALTGGEFGVIEEVLCHFISTPHSRGKRTANVARTMPLILDSVFNHPQLPDEVTQLKSEIYARWYLDLGFSFLIESNGADSPDIEIAADFIHKGVALHPSRKAWRDEFISSIGEKIITSVQDDEAEDYLHVLLKRLFPPTGTPDWVINHMIAQLHAVLAFRAYEKGCNHAVQHHVYLALKHNPGLLKNRGIPSIFVRSLLHKPA